MTDLEFLRFEAWLDSIAAQLRRGDFQGYLLRLAERPGPWSPTESHRALFADNLRYAVERLNQKP